MLDENLFADVEAKSKRAGSPVKATCDALLIKQLEHEERALEAILGTWNSINWQDPVEQMYDTAAGSTSPLMFPPPPYFRRSVNRGEDIPVYTSEQHLALLRDVSRLLCSTSEYAIGGLENRVSYLIGQGLKYSVATLSGATVPDGYLTRTQSLIDVFHEFNGLDEIEREACWRMDVDGEAFLRLFPQANGLMRVRFVEPELVTSSSNAKDQYNGDHNFGIECDPDDIEQIKGYWIIERPLVSRVPKLIPEGEVIHLKQGNYRSAKRGRPLFYAVSRNLKRIEELMGSLSAMAKARAKIALIRRLRGGTPAAIAKLRDSVTSTASTNSLTGQTTNIEQYQDGTILTSSDNIEYDMPGANTGASEFVEVLKAELRGVAARLVMPEWMLTSNATDMGAYTSSLVAEAPSTRMFLRLQKYFRQRFGEGRVGVRKSLISRYLEHLVETGWLDGNYLHLVKIKADAPSVVVHDKEGEANINKTYHDMGVKSVETIRAETGLENSKEEENFSKEQPKEKPLVESNPVEPVKEAVKPKKMSAKAKVMEALRQVV
jgi:hypothetical protein